MATVFMKWLERSPQMYDRGIRLLTIGQLDRLWDEIATKFIRPGLGVLELGCGTGGLAVCMAEAGAKVTAIDVSPAMMAIAVDIAKEAGISDQIQFKRLDATQIGDHFSEASFDIIVTSLMMSELTSEERELVLEICYKLIVPGGRIVLLDEVIPRGIFNQLLYYIIRIPLAFVTWLLTRTGTHPLRDVEIILEEHGYQVESVTSLLAGSLCIFSAYPSSRPVDIKETLHRARLRHRVTLKTLLLDLWTLFFRIIPPYPKVKPDLYVVGQPSQDSPVLVTCNFDLTVRRVVKGLDGRINAWLLVVDSAGINVWCAAGGGFLTADKIISAIRTSHLEEVVNQRELVLPQLSAVGVDGNEIRERIGWSVKWGPVRVEDIPDYVDGGFIKTEAMRQVRFPILDRLEMVSGTLGFYGLLLLVPIAIFWRHLLLPAAIAMVALSYIYAFILPWLPGRDGLAKSIPLTVIALLGVIAHAFLLDPVPTGELFNRAMGITALSVFIAGEFQGMSPLMRGEQANWIPEAVIAVVLGVAYWLLPTVLGWR